MRGGRPTEPAAARQVLFAALVLRGVALGARLDFLGHGLEPGLAVVAAVAVTGPAFVVVQVLAIGIGLGHAVQALGLVHVPTHEIDRVGEVVAAGAPAAGVLLVVVPGLVLDLGVAIGGADAAPGNEAQEVIAGRHRVLFEGGLLVHHGHGNGHRRAPFLLHLEGGVVPVRLFPEDGADVVGVRGRRGGAAGERQQQGRHQEPDHWRGSSRRSTGVPAGYLCQCVPGLYKNVSSKMRRLGEKS